MILILTIVFTVSILVLAKMSLVMAGIGDLTRPADKLSTNQSLTLGIIIFPFYQKKTTFIHF
jgi:hypothetical protein